MPILMRKAGTGMFNTLNLFNAIIKLRYDLTVETKGSGSFKRASADYYKNEIDSKLKDELKQELKNRTKRPGEKEKYADIAADVMKNNKNIKQSMEKVYKNIKKNGIKGLNVFEKRILVKKETKRERELMKKIEFEKKEIDKELQKEKKLMDIVRKEKKLREETDADEKEEQKAIQEALRKRKVPPLITEERKEEQSFMDKLYELVKTGAKASVATFLLSSLPSSSRKRQNMSIIDRMVDSLFIAGATSDNNLESVIENINLQRKSEEVDDVDVIDRPDKKHSKKSLSPSNEEINEQLDDIEKFIKTVNENNPNTPPENIIKQIKKYLPGFDTKTIIKIVDTVWKQQQDKQRGKKRDEKEEDEEERDPEDSNIFNKVDAIDIPVNNKLWRPEVKLTKRDDIYDDPMSNQIFKDWNTQILPYENNKLFSKMDVLNNGGNTSFDHEDNKEFKPSFSFSNSSFKSVLFETIYQNNKNNVFNPLKKQQSADRPFIKNDIDIIKY